MSRTASGGFETSTGTLYVSKPYKSRSSPSEKKLRALVSFVPRNSAFDINSHTSNTNEFRGFFSLFWISIFIFTIRTYIRSIETSGEPLNLDFAAMFSKDAITLAWSDLVLVLTTGLCVPFAIALKRNWLKYYWTGVIVQHVFQTSVLMAAITWIFRRDWPWVQSGFLTLHALVMVMKMHSYMNVNGHLQTVRTQADAVLAQLMKLVAEESSGLSSEEAWANALVNARIARMEKEGLPSDTESQGSTSGNQTPVIGTPEVPPHAAKEGAVSSYVDAATAAALRKRLTAVIKSPSTLSNGVHLDPKDGGHPLRQVYSESDEKNKSKGTVTLAQADASSSATVTTEFAIFSNRPPETHTLVHHSNPDIAALAEEYSDLLSELTSNGPKDYTVWPANIGWKDFAMYQLTPTLVYELEYPRTDRIRPLYLFEKTVATFGTFALLYTVTDRFILPYTPTRDQSFFRSLLDLALPFMIAYLLLFYIIFECICNGFAELSYFADRQFYEDWWNSTSWDEFSRKWNKPVHTFLLRHVYAASILSSYRMSKISAMFFTFALSAAAHELVMVIVTRKIRMYLFMLQIIQIPLILIGRAPVIKRNKLMGNVVFWLGLYAGFPLLCVAYVAH
ncbi:sterol O-acyltransferase [Coprinopsis marcescibilis]|uniref:O-acyltransferase n=1 Tax=Coprinopsis marcescibilis TaxID=230819 RepID=A0A5C3LAS0_COPMA|nr:sterol O-acyltransferase [Coprinopsis marcescibilis]